MRLALALSLCVRSAEASLAHLIRRECGVERGAVEVRPEYLRKVKFGVRGPSSACVHLLTRLLRESALRVIKLCRTTNLVELLLSTETTTYAAKLCTDRQYDQRLRR